MPVTTSLNPDFVHHLKSLTRFIYYVTEEEDRFILNLRNRLSKFERRIWVYNATMGMLPLPEYVKDWETRAHQESPDTTSIHQALIKIYKDNPREDVNFYVITDPERFLPDPHVQRRILNVAHQLHNDEHTVKVLIFVGQRLYVPAKLQRYIQVVHDRGLNDEDLETVLSDIYPKLKMDPQRGLAKAFKGLTTYEIDAAIAQSIIKTKDTAGGKRIDPQLVADFKRKQLQKTDLLQYIDVSDFTFEKVGGAQRFKDWVSKAKASWTEEGQSFGLKPPKGVLAVGVWGCGKSLSVKAMGNAWRLPVVQLEMGKLRSSGVGESEANVYRAINLIEAVAPCLVWVDEAEKSLAGNQSSAASDAGTTSRTIGILSTWLQETTSQVCLAMTANSLKTLPVEFVNRMDERFFFDLPSEDERVEILKIHLTANKQDPTNFPLADLAEAAKHMVGREIEQAILAAMVESFHNDKESLDPEILVDELKKKPRIFKTMVDELKEVLDWVGYDPDIDDGIRARLASNKRSETFRQLKVE